MTLTTNKKQKYHYVLDILVTCETIIKHNQDNLHLNSFILLCGFTQAKGYLTSVYTAGKNPSILRIVKNKPKEGG